MMIVSPDADELRAKLWGSFLDFTRFFFPVVTGREFIISNPQGRESHFITISRELTSLMRLETNSLLITVPPGHGKSVLLSMWTAWCISRYPDSQFLYIAYGHELASKHTSFIKRIIECQDYRHIFGVKLRHDSKAKDFFQMQQGGSVKAFGSGGAITGQDAGLPGLDRFSGAVIIDDPLKPDEAHSETIRGSVLRNYQETILQRPRGPNVPIICIAQRLHEDDLPAYMLSGKDERKYKSVVLKAIDDAGNALYPEVNPLEQLLEKKEKTPYVFASQYQQDPIPSGGALYKEHYFPILEEDPEILCTFITADCAETQKSYNDATAFSFWGVYRLDNGTDDLALHWLDCVELRIEPKDLESEFISFWQECMRYKVKPRYAAIEKKSTGVTLLSVLQKLRGLEIRDIKRDASSGSKSDRFVSIQAHLAAKLISFTAGAKHYPLCIMHMTKITANNSHRWDDIADTLFDAVKIALIDKTLYVENIQQNIAIKNAAKALGQQFQQRQKALRTS